MCSVVTTVPNTVLHILKLLRDKSQKFSSPVEKNTCNYAGDEGT